MNQAAWCGGTQGHGCPPPEFGQTWTPHIFSMKARPQNLYMTVLFFNNSVRKNCGIMRRNRQQVTAHSVDVGAVVFERGTIFCKESEVGRHDVSGCLDTQISRPNFHTPKAQMDSLHKS